jgi:hypothetical protein
MDITYRLNAPLTAQQVAGLFRRSGIRRPLDDLERIQNMRLLLAAPEAMEYYPHMGLENG